MKVYIKNMVCPRCIMAVKNILESMSINFSHIQLGEVSLNQDISKEQTLNLSQKLEAMGFELLNDNQQQLIEQIKALIITHIHQENKYNIVYSMFLKENLHRDYSFLSKLFSSVEGITIEQYIILQKIEKVKELITYDQLTLSEIAFQLGYSSLAHLSSQFKKITGLTPSQFKKQGSNMRQGLDKI